MCFLVDRRPEGSEVCVVSPCPSCQWPGLLGTWPSLLEATDMDETREIGVVGCSEGKWIPCYFCLSPQSHLWFGKLPVLSRPLTSAPDPLLRLSKSSVREYFFGWQVGAEEVNQTLGARNAKCISLIYSDKFPSGYFLYYQTQSLSMKTFVLAE